MTIHDDVESQNDGFGTPDDRLLIQVATTYEGALRDTALLLAAALVTRDPTQVRALRRELLRRVGERFS